MVAIALCFWVNRPANQGENMKVTALLALVAVLFTGCATVAPRVDSSVTVFHQMQAVPAGATYSVVPWRKENEGSLEFKAYAEQVASFLRSGGLTVVPVGQAARFAVFVDYGIDDGRTETTSYSVPQWGVTGSSGSSTTGTVNVIGSTAMINATTVNRPTYGVTGYNQVSTSSRVFRRFVKVDIAELSGDGNPKKVYEGRLKSEGTCGNLPTIMPILLQAMLANFPGESGKARSVELPWSGTC